MLTVKGNSIILDFSLRKPELAKDKILEEKVKEYKSIEEQVKKLVDEGKKDKAIEISSGTLELLKEIQDIYLKDLILNSDIELCVDKKELSYEVPVLYSEE